MKKIKYIILLIIILVIILLICSFTYYTRPKIISGPATLSSEEVYKLNSRFEKYIGINDSQNIEKLLKCCLENYLYYFDECAKVPQIKYITKENEEIIKFDFEDYNNVDRWYKENTDYYINISETIQSLSKDSKYDVTVNYDKARNFEDAFLLNEIEITEIY